MKAFRIGRKPAGIWANRTPPIRGGKFGNYVDEPEVSDEKNPIVDAPINGCLNVPVIGRPISPALEEKTIETCGNGTALCTKRATPRGSPSRREKAEFNEKADGGLDNHRGRAGLTPDQYAQWAVDQAKHCDAEGFPSLDTEVQEEVARKYRALHQRVHDEGLYDCRYLEYGKEMCRYSALFALFLYTLRAEWYMTSAACLGLFWVCSILL